MSSQFIKISERKTYWVYLKANLFMMAPEINIQGKMEHMARASRQFLKNATMNPEKKQVVKLTTWGTFSDMP